VLFVEVVLPVFLVLGAGFAFGRLTDVDLRPLSRLTLVVMSPALVFGYLATAELPAADLARIAAYTLLYIVVAALATAAIVRAAGLEALISPLLLVSVFMNSGNMGLPVVLFAYGEPGFVIGVSTLAVQLFVMYPVGIYFASLHGSRDWRGGLRLALRTPPVLAGLAAAVVRLAGVPVPDFVLRPVRLVGDAGVPTILLLLGMQLARTRVEGSLGPIALGTALRLAIGPLLAVALVYPLGITGLAARVLVLQHAMPAAAIMTLLALEYDARPDLVASVTVVTTVISAVTLTPLLYWLSSAFG
jgi:malate permease and related proteins